MKKAITTPVTLAALTVVAVASVPMINAKAEGSGYRNGPRSPTDYHGQWNPQSAISLKVLGPARRGPPPNPPDAASNPPATRDP